MHIVEKCGLIALIGALINSDEFIQVLGVPIAVVVTLIFCLMYILDWDKIEQISKKRQQK